MKKRIIESFNPKIREILIKSGINIHDGLGILVCFYFNISPSYFPIVTLKKIFATNIVTRNHTTGDIEWNVKLFDNHVTAFDWVEDWMKLFAAVNPGRKGVKSYAISRMKKFFAENPDIRKEEVIEATKLYLNNISDATYCKASHKFISDRNGSLLLDFVKSYRDNLKLKESIAKHKNTKLM